MADLVRFESSRDVLAVRPGGVIDLEPGGRINAGVTPLLPPPLGTTDGKVLTAKAAAPGGADWEAGGGGGSSTLAALTDVALTSPADGDLLSYDAGSGKWVNAVPRYYDGGDGSVLPTLPPGTPVWLHGTYTPPDVAVSDGPTTVLTLPVAFLAISGQAQLLIPPDGGSDSDFALTSTSIAGGLQLSASGPLAGFVQQAILAGSLGSGALCQDINSVPHVEEMQLEYTVNSTPGATAPTIYSEVFGVVSGLTV